MTDNRASREAGYTLIELATAVLILAVVSGVSFFKLRPVLEHGRVNSAAATLATDLQYAQFLAARQRTPVVVIPTSATKSYIIRDRADATAIYKTRYMDSNTEYGLDSLTTTASSLEIFPTGVTHATTTFTLWLGGYNRQVRFTKAGQIRVVNGP